MLSISGPFPPTPRTLITTSVVMLAGASVFAMLNVSKVRKLRSTVTDAVVARESFEQARTKKESDLKAREAAIVAQQGKLAAEPDRKAAASEGQLAQILGDKKQLEAQIQTKDSEIAGLRKQLEEREPASANPGAASAQELQAQLDDARQQLDSAEREKSLLAEKVRAARERSSQFEEERKRRVPTRSKAGLHGTILAVNQAYNFVVVNLGNRNGVEPQSEMLIIQDSTFIGKIRISSVEPATAIGDIITSTLARGVQVQPGDIVIYAGTNS